MSVDPTSHDPANPDPWLALALDSSTFLDQAAKEALLRNNGSWSRRVILPVFRPVARLSIALIQVLRLVIPGRLSSPQLLHATICWGMKYFVSRDANYLILRHFHIGSQMLKFFNANLADGKLPSHPLHPKTIADLGDNVFLQHDLNIYNFIIALNTHLREENREIGPLPRDTIDFSAIEDVDSQIEPLPDRWHNFLDLQSAIELYTPIFALFLRDDDFWRSSNSLQLDETVAVYAAKMFDREFILSMVSNKHPMVPYSTFEAGFRLMLHGLDSENLYGFIKYIRDHSKEAVPV